MSGAVLEIYNNCGGGDFNQSKTDTTEEPLSFTSQYERQH